MREKLQVLASWKLYGLNPNQDLSFAETHMTIVSSMHKLYFLVLQNNESNCIQHSLYWLMYLITVSLTFIQIFKENMLHHREENLLLRMDNLLSWIFYLKKCLGGEIYCAIYLRVSIKIPKLSNNCFKILQPIKGIFHILKNHDGTNFNFSGYIPWNYNW